MVSEEISEQVTSVSPHETPGGSSKIQREERTLHKLGPALRPRRLIAALSDGAPCQSTSTVKSLEAAQTLANVFAQYDRLRHEHHLSLTGAAKFLGKSPSLFSGLNSAYARFKRGGVSALLPDNIVSRRHSPSGELSRQIGDLGWFIPAARFFYLNTNRNSQHGSIPEAVRRSLALPNLPPGWKTGTCQRFAKAIQRGAPSPKASSEDTSGALGDGALPTCPPSIREACLARARAGKPLVPDRISRQIACGPFLVRHHRNKKEAALDYLSAPGSMFFFHDPVTGEWRPPLAGEVIEGDDSTINFPVCVPWKLGGDPCSDRYGVKIGRFQWLVAIDAARRFVTAWSYIIRPRSSYRAEDVLILMRNHCAQHGVPLQWRFEQGTWKSKLVQQAIALMGSHLHSVWSPHQKPFIEGLFNTLWTKLSVQFPGCDVGRFQGETHEASKLFTACRNGHQDPRKHFPMLQAAIAAFSEVVAEKNHTPVNSDIGRWIPADAWANRENFQSQRSNLQSGGIRRLPPETDWIFAPYTREWKVTGMTVGGRVRLFEDLAVPFDFHADWLPHFHGARVRLHFDPHAANCLATIVLLKDWVAHGRRHRAGEVLGSAKQLNSIAQYARLVLGWGEDDTNAGRLARQRTAAAVAREHRAVVPSGQGLARADFHDGLQHVAAKELRATEITDGRARPLGTSHNETGALEFASAGAMADREAGIPNSAESRAAKLAELQEFERRHQHLFT